MKSALPTAALRTSLPPSLTVAFLLPAVAVTYLIQVIYLAPVADGRRTDADGSQSPQTPAIWVMIDAAVLSVKCLISAAAEWRPDQTKTYRVDGLLCRIAA